MPKRMQEAGVSYRRGGSLKRLLPSAKRGGQASLLTKISRAPKKKKIKGCGCGGQV